MAAHPSYRPELDGLRALAVLSVIGFHAEIPGFSGGYLGVDVFFVLSGYLITRIIRRELTDGTFSLRRFYERRARRILPALLLVAIVSIPIGWFYLPPHRMTQFCDSLISLLTFSTNFHFYFESDYFAPAVAESIWVHGWSLALEEQFYVLFPLALLLLRNRPALTQATCMVLVLTLSFALAVFVSSSDGEASFYLLPMRAWELLAGAIVSFERDEYASPWTSGLGLALIAASVAVLPEVPPGWMTVPAVAGTMLLLRYGRGFGVLSYRPWVAIGLVSYSAYLWHQPIFVLARLRSTGPLSPITTSVCIAATGVLAAASWYAFEQPFRRRLRGRTVASTLMAFALGLAAFAVAGRWSGGFPERFPSDEAALLRYLEYDTSESYSDGRCNLTTN
ncbi:MAG: acyltransferase, partial [Myxococcota bacterium]